MYSLLRSAPTVTEFCILRRSDLFINKFSIHRGTLNRNTISRQPARKCYIYWNPNQLSVKRLIKPLVFTVVFTSGSIAGAAIWQYETMRAHAISMLRKSNWYQAAPKRTEESNALASWWKNRSEAEKVFIPICLINVLTFLAFRVPRLHPTMIKYFASDPTAQAVCWPMLLSTFSHHNFFHMVINMFVLHSFSPGAINTLGKEQFVGFYLAGGVISSMISNIYKTLTKRSAMSIGASGAIMAVLGFMCSQYPDSKLSIVFLPMLTFSAATGLKAVMCVDTAGMVMKWRKFDHAAHMGGALWGIFWCLVGNSQIWAKREPLLQFWHGLRGSAK